MQSFQKQVEDIVGEAAGGDIGFTTAMLNDWLSIAVKAVINRMPPRLLDHFSKKTTFAPTSGTTLTSDKIFSVLRNDGNINRPCRRIPVLLAGRVADSSDILYATKNDPVYYVDRSGSGTPTLKILPASATATYGIAYHVNFPTATVGTTALVGFPDELEHLVPLYAAYLAKLREAGVMRRSSQTELEAITTSGYLSSFEGALPSYTAPAKMVMPTAALYSMTSLPDYSAAGLFHDPPTMTSLPTLSLSTMTSLPTYTTPTIGTAIGTLSITNKTITDPGTLTLPSAPTFPSLTLPAPPTATFSYASAGSEPASTISPGAAPVFNAPAAFTFDSTTYVEDALSKAQKIIDDGANVGGDSAAAALSVQTNISGEDLEKAASALQLAQTEINRANTAIQNELGQLREYEAELQESLGKFNGDISQYQNRVQEEVQEVQAGIAAYSAKAQDNLNELSKQVQQYQSDIQKYQGETQAAVQEYQSKVRKAIDDYQAQANAKINEYRANVERYIREFEVEMQADVTEWTEQKKADLEKFRLDFQEGLGEYQALVNAYIDQYKAKTNAEINEYQSLSSAYIAEFNAKVQASLGEYKARTQAFIAEYTAKNHAILTGFQESVAAEIGRYQADAQAEATKFQVNLDKAKAYLEEAAVRLQTMQSFDQKSQLAFTEAASLLQQWDTEIHYFIGETSGDNV